MTIKNYSDKVLLVELPQEPDTRKCLDQVMDIAGEGSMNVLLDCSKVNILVSMSLSGLLMLHEMLVKSGRRMVLFNVAAITRDIMKVTCFDGIFEFEDDFDAALNQIEQTTAHAETQA